jgi:hypothetical protein
MNFPLYFYFICLGFLVSLTIAFRRENVLYLRLFSPFLMTTAIVEVLGFYLLVRRENNTILYNLFSIVEFLFYFFVLNRIIHNRTAKRIIFQISWIYALLSVANIIFVQKITVFNTMTYSLGCLLIAAVCIYYFLELFQLPHAVNLARQPAFWICSGLLFYYACSFPLFGFANFIRSWPYVIVKNLATLIDILNIFLYSSFTVAFLCRVKTRKSMS